MPSFYSPELTDKTDRITLEREEFHHLAHVMRHQSGDTVKLNSGKGWFGIGTILSIEKARAIIQVSDVSCAPQPQHPYALAFSLLRSKHDEWLVEKLTELGVSALFPLMTEHSVRNPSANTMERFRKTALSAIKQCDNPYLPNIYDIQTLDKAIPVIHSKGYKLVVASELRPVNWMDGMDNIDKPCFFIGPEGGFSPGEFELLKDSGAVEICLSQHILRAETAAVAAASQYILIAK